MIKTIENCEIQLVLPLEPELERPRGSPLQESEAISTGRVIEAKFEKNMNRTFGLDNNSTVLDSYRERRG